MSKKKIAILGGGITGVTMANELAKDPQLEVEVIENSHALGGFHRNIEIDGLNYDIGAFTFHQDHNLFRSFPSIVKLYKSIANNFGSVTDKGSLDSYPCTLNGYTKDNGLLAFLRTCIEIPFSKLYYWRKNTVPAYVKYYIGGNAYRKTGLKNYIERLYKVSDDDIDLQFAHKRLGCIQSTGSLRNIIAKKIEGKADILTSPVLRSALVRPKEGFTKIYSELHQLLLAKGVDVSLNREVKSIKKPIKDQKQKFEIEFADSTTKTYDGVVSTIPIPVISRLIGKPLQKKLESITLLTLFYRFKGNLNHDHNVLHNFTSEGAWKKITTFSHYYGKHEGDDYFSVEITLDQDASPDVAQQQQQFEEHVRSLGLFEGELKLRGSKVTPNAYPVYLVDNVDEIIMAKNQLKDWGLFLAGRQGEFDYLNSSDAAGNAVNIANQIKNHYQQEDYQQEARECVSAS
jgi:protoporphyrinogen oxidase